MTTRFRGIIYGCISLIFVTWLSASMTNAQSGKEIRIGILNSLTGPFATGGGMDAHHGFELAIDMTNKAGGVLGKYKIAAVIADDQSNPEIGIREVQRLSTLEKLPLIAGLYSSSIAAPAGVECEKNRTILWINIAIADALLKGKHFRYVFRPQHAASQYAHKCRILV